MPPALPPALLMQASPGQPMPARPAHASLTSPDQLIICLHYSAFCMCAFCIPHLRSGRASPAQTRPGQSTPARPAHASPGEPKRACMTASLQVHMHTQARARAHAHALHSGFCMSAYCMSALCPCRGTCTCTCTKHFGSIHFCPSCSYSIAL